jgi:hypothetical protein
MTVNLLTLIIQWSFLFCLNAPSAGYNTTRDTINVVSTGTGNEVVINSPANKYDDSVRVSENGEIVQTGSRNRVEINTGPVKKDTSGIPVKRTVKINQTGQNNSVKINSQ